MHFQVKIFKTSEIFEANFTDYQKNASRQFVEVANVFE